ncbi:hypothetical protein PLEOSDRAFT_1048159, partial [Pleurotus ostreatus PC15]
CYHNPKGRIIVISADGTSNKFGNKSTNVVEFHSRVVKDEDQITLYLGGIGTYADNKLQALLDMAVATTFDRNVFKAYEWLSENYKEGDRIYLFGMVIDYITSLTDISLQGFHGEHIKSECLLE